MVRLDSSCVAPDACCGKDAEWVTGFSKNKNKAALDRLVR